MTYLTTRDDVDADAIGVFGTGGTGGGNAVLLAAADPRVKAAISQVPVADGADWLHRMRAEHEWLSFLEGLDEDRRQRVADRPRPARPPARGDHGADARAPGHHGQVRRRRADPDEGVAGVGRGDLGVPPDRRAQRR